MRDRWPGFDAARNEVTTPMPRKNSAARVETPDDAAPATRARKPAPRKSRPVAAAEPASNVAAEWVQLSSIHVWIKNPRRNEEAIPRVSASIIRFGWGRPLVVRAANRELIVGHTASAAARRLTELWADPNLEDREAWHPEAVRTATTGEVPVRFKDMPESEAHLLALADNRLGEYATWEDDMLAEVLKGAFDNAAIAAGEADVTGFLKAELELLIGGGEPAAPAGGATAPVGFEADTGKELLRIKVAIVDGERTRAAIKHALTKAGIAFELD